LTWKIDGTIPRRRRIPVEQNSVGDDNSRASQEALEEEYRQMAADREREIEAEEWIEALIGDVSEVERC
jgi:hypothetical protein